MQSRVENPTVAFVSEMAELIEVCYAEESSPALPAGWVFLWLSPILEDNLFVLRVVTFFNTQTAQLVFVYNSRVHGCTSEAAKLDESVIADSFGGRSEFFFLARRMYTEVMANFPGYQAIHTGRSFAAIVATLMGATKGEQVIGFDSPGVQRMVDSVPEVYSAVWSHCMQGRQQVYLFQSADSVTHRIGKQVDFAVIEGFEPMFAQTNLPARDPLLFEVSEVYNMRRTIEHWKQMAYDLHEAMGALRCEAYSAIESHSTPLSSSSGSIGANNMGHDIEASLRLSSSSPYFHKVPLQMVAPQPIRLMAPSMLWRMNSSS